MKAKNYLQTLVRPSLICSLIVGVSAVAMAQATGATDLSGAATTAATNFQAVLKTGLTAITLVTVIAGLGWSGWAFAHKDDNATKYLMGTIAASVVLGIAAALT